MRQTSPKRLSVEILEDRLTPSTGIPWYDSGKITLSFVPDGTDTGGGVPSALGSIFAGVPQATWQTEILRAFQTWAATTNVNIGIVPDSGLPLGTPGLPQGDPRFGDIRIAARPLSTDATGTLAQTTGFDYSGGTWSGDMVLNSNDTFTIGGGGSTFDLYTVAVHEAGHALSLLNNAADPTSVMWGVYSPKTGLAPTDVAAIQALYGARTADPYEGSGGDDTIATAFNLTQNGNLSAISADLTQAGDVDVYKFTTPTLLSGVNSLKINLTATGISLLTAKVTVLNAAGAVVASGLTTNPLSNNISVSVPNYQAATTYYVRVEGSTANVFSTGAYNLQLGYGPRGYGTSAVSGSQYVNVESLANNNTQSTAATLGMVNAAHSTTFTAVGAVLTPTDTDWYRITPNAVAGFSGTLTVGLIPLSGNGFSPIVSVYNAQGVLLPAAVVTNESGAFTVQLGAQQTGSTFYLKVTAANPAGAQAVGLYALAANLSRAAVTTFDMVGSQTLTAAQPTAYSQVTVGDTRLTQFSLSATTPTGGPTAAVRMTIFDALGNTVYSMVSVAGKPLVTGTLWLLNGTYTFAFSAATQDGSPLPALTFNLGKREMSDPMDPIVVDPIGTPTSPPATPALPDPPVVVILDPLPAPAPGTILGALLSPFAIS
ncbi:MAG TPA: matrixin family metalloprotease [Urbifossiella sp.]|jgi:hypothetical protein|nr:matrixin family metalloprotease [Urbifossiella sp.]